MIAPADVLVPLGRVLISAWVIYQIFKQERSLEPVVRIVRWIIVAAGVGAFLLALKFLPHISIFLLVFLISLPTGLFFLFPELTVYLVRFARAIASRSQRCEQSRD